MSEQPGGQPSRYQRSTSGMVGALLLTFLFVIGFVAFRGCNRVSPDVRPDHVDYRSQVGFAQQDGATLAYPAHLPTGWYATRVDFEAGTRPELGISLLTPDQYVGIRQSPRSIAELLSAYVDSKPSAGPSVTVDGGLVRRWATWTDAGGDVALSARWHHESLLVFGTVPLADLEQLASSLTDAPQQPAP
ncbi:DUF4245 family protein [Nocardioides cynanchi]|uniref:DUF4245 family protein n=1 Tax=Nocardioides cynanchi TaxID=2558918 RepID=UPI001785F0C2|nr:DUF4245 family protein [Nocardioides cynanchi]